MIWAVVAAWVILTLLMLPLFVGWWYVPHSAPVAVVPEKEPA